MVCLKRIKDDKNFLDQSLMEIYVLDYLSQQGKSAEHNFLQLYEHFYHNAG